MATHLAPELSEHIAVGLLPTHTDAGATARFTACGSGGAFAPAAACPQVFVPMLVAPLWAVHSPVALFAAGVARAVDFDVLLAPRFGSFASVDKRLHRSAVVVVHLIERVQME